MLTLAPALALSLHAIFAKPQIIPASGIAGATNSRTRFNEGLISDRFLHKRDTLRQVSRRRMRLPGDGEHAHLRPALLHKSGKLEAIEGAGHVDVSQHSGDFGSPTKHVEGLVSVLRLRNPEPGFTQDIDLNNPH